jgi:hypothetical protein
MEKKLYESVLKNALQTFKGTYKTGISLFLTQVGVLILFMFTVLGGFILMSGLVTMPTLATFTATPLLFTDFISLVFVMGIILLTGMAFISAFFNAALSYAANCDSYKDSFKKALSKFWGILALSLLVFAIIFPAFLLFIIPGIFLSLAISPVLMIYLYEDVSIKKAVSKAFLLTKNKRLDIFILFLFLLGISFASSFIGGVLGTIPLIGFLIKVSLDIIFSYFSVIVYRELYWNLKESEVADEAYEGKYLNISKFFVALSVFLFLASSALVSFLTIQAMNNPAAVSQFLSTVSVKISETSLEK